MKLEELDHKEEKEDIANVTWRCNKRRIATENSIDKLCWKNIPQNIVARIQKSLCAENKIYKVYEKLEQFTDNLVHHYLYKILSILHFLKLNNIRRSFSKYKAEPKTSQFFILTKPSVPPPQ